MTRPISITDAMQTIEQYIIDHIMRPPHYKYRLNSLAYDCMRQWGPTPPVLEIYYRGDDIKTDSLGSYINETTGLTFRFNENTFNKFLNLE